MSTAATAKLIGLEELEALRSSIQAAEQKTQTTVALCCGTGCQAYGSKQLVEAFAKALAKEGLEETVRLRATGCHGFCERGPLVVIHPAGTFYQRVQLDDVDEIVAKTIKQGELIERLLYVDPQTKEKTQTEKQVDFYKHQHRIVFANNGAIDPKSIRDYLALGGYAGLARMLSELKPEEVIEQITESGLRGRGGGGFLTGRKWRSCRDATGEPKYVLCNGDEGDPGAFMDRSIMEGNPHSVL